MCHTPLRLVSTIVLNTGFGVGLRVADRHHPGVGDDDVDFAELVDPGLHSGFQLRQVTDVGDDGHHLAARGFDQRTVLSRSDLVPSA